MENVGNLMGAAFFFETLTFIGILALVLLSIDQTDGIDSDAWLILNNSPVYCSISFVFCFLSEKITTKSLECAIIAYNATWYEMSIIDQKAIILIIMRSQKEYRITGLGLVNCSLEVFLKVIDRLR